MNNKTSTSNEAQRQRLLTHLREKGSICTSEAREQLAVMSPAPRVLELRREGWKIATVMQQIADDAGVLHRQALYVIQRGEEAA